MKRNDPLIVAGWFLLIYYCVFHGIHAEVAYVSFALRKCENKGQKRGGHAFARPRSTLHSLLPGRWFVHKFARLSHKLVSALQYITSIKLKWLFSGCRRRSTVQFGYIYSSRRGSMAFLGAQQLTMQRSGFFGGSSSLMGASRPQRVRMRYVR